MEPPKFNFSIKDLANADLALPEPAVSAYSLIFQWAINMVKQAALKEVFELSEEEKFSIAFLAGVPLAKNESVAEGYSTMQRMQTVPCAICKIDGKFHVAYRDKNP